MPKIAPDRRTLKKVTLRVFAEDDAFIVSSATDDIGVNRLYREIIHRMVLQMRDQTRKLIDEGEPAQ